MFLCYIGILWLNVKDCYVIAVFVVVRFVADLSDSYCVLDRVLMLLQKGRPKVKY